MFNPFNSFTFVCLYFIIISIFQYLISMPLLLISGGPSSGKTTIAERIAEYFKSCGFHAVEVISDECNGNFSRNIYNNSSKVCFINAGIVYNLQLPFFGLLKKSYFLIHSNITRNKCNKGKRVETKIAFNSE